MCQFEIAMGFARMNLDHAKYIFPGVVTAHSGRHGWLRIEKRNSLCKRLSIMDLMTLMLPPLRGLLSCEYNGLSAATDINLGSCSAGLNWHSSKEANEVILIYMLANDFSCNGYFTRWTFVYCQIMLTT